MTEIRLSFFKVLTLPSVGTPNSFYAVDDGTTASLYLTDRTGVPHAVLNVANIRELIEEAITNGDVTISWDDIDGRPQFGTGAFTNIITSSTPPVGQPDGTLWIKPRL